MNNEFTGKNDELKRVAEEIRLLRVDLNNASASLGRIERRLRVAFPNYPEKPKRSKKTRNAKRAISLKTSQELQSIFNDLVAHTQNEGDSAFLAKVEELKEEDLFALAIELGIGSSSKLSRRKATDGIRKRVQEVMLLQFEKK